MISNVRIIILLIVVFITTWVISTRPLFWDASKLYSASFKNIISSQTWSILEELESKVRFNLIPDTDLENVKQQINYFKSKYEYEQAIQIWGEDRRWILIRTAQINGLIYAATLDFLILSFITFNGYRQVSHQKTI